MTKNTKAILSVVVGFIFFVSLYDFVLWNKFVFPQIMTEPAVGRDLLIRKKLSAHEIPKNSTFVFGSSKALNGINCFVLEKEKNLTGECFNFGIPGAPVSFEEYVSEILKLEPKNIIFIQDYMTLRALFSDKATAACKALPASNPLQQKQDSSIFKLGIWNYKGFLKRWSYKNRLLYALIGIDEGQGFGRIGGNFKNPLLIPWHAEGLEKNKFHTKKEQLEFYFLEEIKDQEVCFGELSFFLNLFRVIHEQSPKTHTFLVLYPAHPFGLKALDLPERYFKRDSFFSVSDEPNSKILNFLNLFSSDKLYWGDPGHISLEGIDIMSSEILEEIRKAQT